MTADHLAKLQAGRAAASAARHTASESEDSWHEAIHAQAYVDMLRCRAQNAPEPDFLNID